MSTQWKVANYPDANLIPSNIKDGVSIFGVLGNFSWSISSWDQIIYWTDPEGNDRYFDNWDVSYRAVELWDFIYMFASHSRYRISWSWSGIVCWACKYNKTNWDFTPIWVHLFNQSGSNSWRFWKTYSSYVNGTNIVLNYTRWTNDGRIILDTTDDSLSSVLWSLDTAWTLFSTEEINFGWVDHKANVYYAWWLISSTYYKWIIFYYTAL